LCVFVGRFTLEDVESVCSSDDVPVASALDLLASLVDKSLVMKVDAGGLACYRLHETMREYAGLELREAGEEESLDARFVEYYATRCQRSAAEARYRLVEWLEWVELEIDNIRSVLQRCLIRADYPRGLGLAVSLSWYWFTRAATEGVRWLDALLASGGGSTEARAWAYYLRGFLSVVQADPAGARPALERGMAAARETEQLPLLSCLLSMASVAENMAGDRVSAKRLLEESRALTDGLDAFAAVIAFHQARALDGFFRGDLDTVRSASTEGARLSRDAGDQYSLCHMLENLGFAALISGDVDGARPLLEEALRIAHEIDDRVAQHYLVRGLGCRAAASGEARRAARLLGAAETIRTRAGADVMAFLAPLLAEVEDAAVAALGQPRFDAEFEGGRRLSRDAAVELALGESAPAVTAAADGASSGLLGRREAEVARLIADGLSNKQIGARLFISERTVEGHVRNVLNKAGFSSRAQIAAWISSSNR
jgi:DNA-binding CsgD family transcriptional regulator